MKAYLRLLHPVRAWRRASTRTRIYRLGVAVFFAGVVLAHAGSTYPATRIPGLVVACVGAVVVLVTIRPADRGKS